MDSHIVYHVAAGPFGQWIKSWILGIMYGGEKGRSELSKIERNCQ